MPWRPGYCPERRLARLIAQIEVLTKQFSKYQATAGESVKVGRVNRLVAGIAHCIVSLVIGEDHHQVGAACSFVVRGQSTRGDSEQRKHHKSKSSVPFHGSKCVSLRIQGCEYPLMLRNVALDLYGAENVNSVALLDLALFRVWVFRISDFGFQGRSPWLVLFPLRNDTLGGHPLKGPLLPGFPHGAFAAVQTMAT